MRFTANCNMETERNEHIALENLQQTEEFQQADVNCNHTEKWGNGEGHNIILQ